MHTIARRTRDILHYDHVSTTIYYYVYVYDIIFGDSRLCPDIQSNAVYTASPVDSSSNAFPVPSMSLQPTP